MATRVSTATMVHPASQASRDEAEIIAIFLTKMLRNFEEITGKHVPTPPVLVDENLGRNAIYFPQEGPRQGTLKIIPGITLDPDYQRTARHESVHIFRHVTLNVFATPAGEVGKVLFALEEGLADLLTMFGTLTKKGGTEHTKEAFRRYETVVPSIFEVAAEIQNALARGGATALYDYTGRFPFGTERMPDGSPLAGPHIYRIGAGLSASLFAINGFQADKTVEIALTRTGKQILTGIRRATEIDPEWIAYDLEKIRRKIENGDSELGTREDVDNRSRILVSSKV